MKNLFLVFLTLFTLISQIATAQKNEIIEKPFYLDKSELYNTTLPIQYQSENVSIDNNLNNTQNTPKYIQHSTIENTTRSPEAQPNFNPKSKQFYSNIHQVSEKNSSLNSDSQEQFLKQTSQYKKRVPFIKSNTKTVGNYFGIDFINTHMHYKESYKTSYSDPYQQANNDRLSSEYLHRNKNSFGFHYLYAINYQGFFIAPEIFYYHHNLRKNFDLNSNETDNISKDNLFGYKWSEINNQLGFKLNIGYDLNSDFAPYLFVGATRIKYSNLYSIYQKDERKDVITKAGIDPLRIHHNTAIAPAYGFGAKIKLSSRLFINGEYFATHFTAKTNAVKYPNYENKEFKNSSREDSISLKTYLRILKIGLSYNF